MRKRRFLAVAALVAGLIAAGWLAERVADRPILPFSTSPTVSTLTVRSKLLHKSMGQIVIEPHDAGSGKRSMVVLLHGRNAGPATWPLDQIKREIGRLGPVAPIVLLADGDDASYFHDRATGRYGSYIMREVIPQAILKTHADRRRLAIGGISMGGFGAFDLARLYPSKFCAVGGHSAALWRFGYETPQGAFDDAADFTRHDVFAASNDPKAFGTAQLWIDGGTQDPFRSATDEFVANLRAAGRPVTRHVWPGAHDGNYWGRHIEQYLRFYARALQRC